MKRCFIYFLFVMIAPVFGCVNSMAQNNDSAAMAQKIEEQANNIQALQREMNNRTYDLEKRVDRLTPATFLLILFGAFCALWAQNTNRNPWYWFFVGVFFNVITVLVLLLYNSRDRDAERRR